MSPRPATGDRFASFGEFYPFYIHEHSNRTCRRIHVIGSGLVLVALAYRGFGWAGVLGLRQGMSGLSTALAALTAGILFMALLFFTLRFLIAMRDDGTLNYRNALGLRGQVYVTVPAARSGPGQVEIKLQGRLITATAVTDSPTPLPPRQPIMVTSVEEANLLV
eukprot:gene17602-21533_t